ncbi:trehalase [Coprinopsis cinerea AmutBmut pab1-1]|nr:trehalase [Coprinopsis cinerea AmutBmut pab1-1]
MGRRPRSSISQSLFREHTLQLACYRRIHRRRFAQAVGRRARCDGEFGPKWTREGFFISSMTSTYQLTCNFDNQMFEKFSNLDIDSAGRGGEYVVQAGFGWTNGVLLWVASNYGGALTTPECPNLLEVPTAPKPGSGSGSEDEDGGSLGRIHNAAASWLIAGLLFFWML